MILDVPAAEVPYHLEPDPTIPVVAAYEDDDLLIVDKPAGLVVHPAPGHWRGTLVNALLARPATTTARSPASRGPGSSTGWTATRPAC